MQPIDLFNEVWRRCAQLSALYGYLEANTTAVLQPTELLRAEWVARVSALDLYVHELVAQNMVAIFEGRKLPTPAYQKFQISNETLARIRGAASPSDASAAFDLEVRRQLGLQTYQDPDKIADGIRLFSGIELWNAIALHLGATESNKIIEAKRLKRELSLVIQRRNKIAHEGDLQPIIPREPWPIHRNDLSLVTSLVERIVASIDAVSA